MHSWIGIATSVPPPAGLSLARRDLLRARAASEPARALADKGVRMGRRSGSMTGGIDLRELVRDFERAADAGRCAKGFGELGRRG